MPFDVMHVMGEKQQSTIVKHWLPFEDIEESCLEQAHNLARLPFVHSHVALMPDCLVEDTEILTDKGFKLIKDLQKGDLIANVNPEKKLNECNVFFAPPKSVIVRDMKEGESILSFYSSHFDKEIKVTNKHRMPFSSSLGVEAESVPSITIIKDYEWGGHGLIQGNEMNIPDELICLVAWTVGDGNIKYSNLRKDGSYSSRYIRFGFKKERKINRVINLLDCLQFQYSVIHSEKQTTISISTMDSIKLIEMVGENKEYPLDWIYKLSKRQSILLLDEAIKVDGDYANFIKSNTVRFNSKRDSDMNFISSLIALNIGVANTNSRISKGFGKETSISYTSAILNYNLYEANNGIHESKVVKRVVDDYNGKVVCVTCNSGFFIARQNGLTFVTGNCHSGYGMPIGGVLATNGVIIPNAVGVDIGCGVISRRFNLKLNELRNPEKTLKEILGLARENIPVGFNKRALPIDWYPIDIQNPIIAREYKNSTFQLGTLGGGNHFIEMQVDEDDYIWVTIHSGSRNLGKQVCDHYNAIAKDLNSRYFSSVPAEYDLAFLPMNTKEGEEYLDAMSACLMFAKLNREVMMGIFHECMNKIIEVDIPLMEEINCHHNYAVLENHFGKEVWVHRKGAIRAMKGELGIIPGSMGTSTYIVEGLGNIQSFCSASHGAGRKMGRNEANKTFSIEEANESIEGVVFGRWGTDRKGNTDISECPLAYKPIEEVMKNQSDLVKPIRRLTPIACMKG